VKAALVVVALASAVAACAAEAEIPPPSEVVPQQGAAEATDRIDLGELTPGSEATFDIPEGTLGFNVTVQGDDTAQIGVEALVSPSGEKVVDAFFLPGATADHRMAVIGGRGASAVSVPQSNATATRAVEHGTWRVVVSGIVPNASKTGTKSSSEIPEGARSTHPLQVTVALQRTEDGEFHGGELDLHVWVPDGLRVHDPDPVHDVSASGAANDRSLAKRIDAFYEDLERLFGISRGRVTFHAIDRSFLSVNGGNARAAIAKQATRDGSPSMHVALTNDLVMGDGESILGYCAGIPGSATASGAVSSAIVVAIYDGGTAANDAITILHEMGHFAGLMHNEESDGVPDLLADTPSHDANNLMAPDGPLKAAVVSPSQVRIVRGSAIYRAKRVR
jgi:hypothetical protein